MKIAHAAAAIAALIITAAPCPGAKTRSTMFLSLERIFDDGGAEIKSEFIADGSSFTLACDRYVSERGAVAEGPRPALVLRTRCEKADRPRAGTAIWVHGSPFADFDEEPRIEHLALLSLGYDVVTPLYPSTGGRPLDVRPDRISPNFDDAVAEVIAVIKSARRSGGRLILLGDTTGALLAAAAARHLRVSDKLVLQGPWLKPLRQAFDPDENLVEGTVPLDRAAAKILSRAEQVAFSRQLLDRFYGAWAERDPIAFLAAHPPRDMLVIYGDKDEEIGLERMPALLAVGGRCHRALVLRGAGHEGIATRADLDRLVEELAR
jgi:acetyl esterase/lipase